ncbi:AAA domain (dynein-related subfamily) [Devosia sp. YR412]|uniref:AAA family ATPase n=1 Tax=Devosia sp. YR412 TaxID=1881030 RepID=UPI0008B1CB74|nr:AAA family ATPase [Devosia sp. YR412]SEP82200.1 AAA domain (dynein-related subfamily) [Devosia sp. YR412]
MQYDSFKEWLAGRGGAKNSVNTRSNALRKLERELGQLNISHSDLDSAFSDDQFASIRISLDQMRDDARAGGTVFRALFPESSDPLNRIANTKAWLGQYAQFLSGAAQNDEVRTDDTFWIVGASFGGNDDQTQRFVQDGMWEIRTPDQNETTQIKSMKIGDRIAIKAAFVQKRNLPFDNRNQSVSVMRIKARGVITDNPANGQSVSVAWDLEFEPCEWYFYTYRPTIWAVRPGSELANRLIAFVFFDESQDISWFRNHPSWAKQYGDDRGPLPKRYWIEKTIVAGRDDRLEGQNALGLALWSPQQSKDGKNIYGNMLQVQAGDIVFHLTDNEEISSVSVAAEVADPNFVGLEGSEWSSQPAYRIPLQDHQPLVPPLPRAAFLETDPFASELRELASSGVKGLFFNRSLALNQGAYLTEATPTLLSILSRAYEHQAGKPLPFVESDNSDAPDQIRTTYTLEDALEPLFMDKETAEELLILWRAKRNVVLQGPPGVGKSFAAHKFAYALMGEEDPSRVGFVQFHQSYAYEDFVEGYRPTTSGFELRPGKFVEFCRQAEADPNRTYVFIIDEINRGNLSKILGELMLLIEGDKRSPKWAMSLASGRAQFHVPANVFLMGLMNTADRSLAVVDYALRRRFAFVDLAPNLDSPKFLTHLEKIGITRAVSETLISQIGRLNREIVGDTSNLGAGFAIGHSFFCGAPTAGETDRTWYNRIIRTEIVPLLREYWFDAPQKADTWRDELLIAQ